MMMVVVVEPPAASRVEVRVEVEVEVEVEEGHHTWGKSEENAGNSFTLLKTKCLPVLPQFHIQELPPMVRYLAVDQDIITHSED